MNFLERVFRHTKTSTMVSGVLLALLGIISFAYGEETVLGLVRLAGIIAVILGICRITDAIVGSDRDKTQVGVGIVTLIVGLVLMLAPDAFINIVFIILGLVVLGIGITAFDEGKEKSSTRDVFCGVCDMILGVLMAIAPFAFIHVVTIISGIALLVAGITEIAASMAMENDPIKH